MRTRWGAVALAVGLVVGPAVGRAQERATLGRIREALDAVPAVDTHDHLWRPGWFQDDVHTPNGEGMTLHAVWRGSYYPWINRLTSRERGQTFEGWWEKAKHDFDDARATTFYRYMLPAFQDLYGVDFDRITEAQAAELERRILENYRDPMRWVSHVVRERANIAVMVNDPYWSRLDFEPAYPFEVAVLNVTGLVDGFHPSEFRNPGDDPYRFAQAQGMEVKRLDDYVRVLDRLLEVSKGRGIVGLKCTVAYQRTLAFENVSAERAAAVFGRPRAELSKEEIKAFEDFIMWRLVELAGRHDLPVQIHTGQARIQGSNPMLLVDLIEANPRTKFSLFHGGYPWVGETGAIVMRHGSHVWVDSVWLPTISFTMAKRAFHEWLEVMPSNRILWGADGHHAEGIYGATVLTRRCLAEVLAEKVEAGDLREEDAVRIGRQVLRENALELFPTLKGKVEASEGAGRE